MTTSARIEAIERTVARIERLLLSTNGNQSKWVTEQEAMIITGLSKDSLRKMRYSGKITKYKALQSGRKFQYDKSELESLFTITV